MEKQLRELYLNGLLTYLTNVKAEIEKDGLIPTIDEAIIRVKALKHDLTEDQAYRWGEPDELLDNKE
jgi:hypothetical protein